MATLSSVVVEFIANTAKYVQGLTTVSNETKKFSDSASKNVDKVSGEFDKLSKSINGLVVASAIKQFTTFALNAVNEIGKINDIAETTGMSIKEIQGLKFVGTQTGNDINQLVTGLENLNNKLQDARIKGGDAALTFADMGIELEKFNNMAKSERLVVLANYIKNAKDEAYAWSNVQDLLGDKLGPKMRAAIMMYADGIDVVLDKTAQANQMLSDDFVKSMDQASKKIDSLQNKLKVLASSVLVGGAEGLGEWAARLILQFEKVGASEEELMAIEEAVLESRKRSIQNNIEFSKSIGGVDLQLYQSQLAEVNAELKVLYDRNAAIDAQAKRRREARQGATIEKPPAPTLTPLSEITDQLKQIARIDDLGERISKLQNLVSKYAGQVKILKPITDELDKQKEEAIKLGNSYRELIDPVYAYDRAVKKIKSATLTPEEQQKAIEALSNAYLFAIEPAKKYEQEVAKINADKGLTNYQKAESIRLLGKEYFDIIEPAKKYYDLIKDLDAQIKNGIRTDKEKAAVLNNIGQSYREAYDPAARLEKIEQELSAIPESANIDRKKYIETLGDGYRSLITPTLDYQKKLREIDALTKEVTTRSFEFSTGTKVAFETARALSVAEGEQLKKLITDQFNLDQQRQKSLLIDDKKLIAANQLKQTEFEINRLFGEQPKTLEDQLRKQEALRVAQAKYFAEVTPYFKELAQFGENFASGLASAIVEGQNFSSALSNVFKSVLKQIEVMILRTLILLHL